MTEIRATVIVEPTVYIIPQWPDPPLELIAWEATLPTPQSVTGEPIR